jgi:hypothetical protein
MNLGISTPSRYASALYVAGLNCGPGLSHTLGQVRSLASVSFGEGGNLLVLSFSIAAEGLPPRNERVMLGDPLRAQDDPAVYACEGTLGAGKPRAIFGSSPLGAIANAVTVAIALVEGRGEVTWK